MKFLISKTKIKKFSAFLLSLKKADEYILESMLHKEGGIY